VTRISDEMLDRHAAQGVVAADQFRRGAGASTDAAAVAALVVTSRRMAKIDGIIDKAMIGFLAMAAICSFHLRLMNLAEVRS
jgi:hypothetical protein